MDILLWIGTKMLNPWVYYPFLILIALTFAVTTRDAIWAYKENDKKKFSKELFRTFLSGFVIIFFLFFFK